MKSCVFLNLILFHILYSVIPQASDACPFIVLQFACPYIFQPCTSTRQTHTTDQMLFLFLNVPAIFLFSVSAVVLPLSICPLLPFFSLLSPFHLLPSLFFPPSPCRHHATSAAAYLPLTLRPVPLCMRLTGTITDLRSLHSFSSSVVLLFHLSRVYLCFPLSLFFSSLLCSLSSPLSLSGLSGVFAATALSIADLLSDRGDQRSDTSSALFHRVQHHKR